MLQKIALFSQLESGCENAHCSFVLVPFTSRDSDPSWIHLFACLGVVVVFRDLRAITLSCVAISLFGGSFFLSRGHKISASRSVILSLETIGPQRAKMLLEVYAVQ